MKIRFDKSRNNYIEINKKQFDTLEPVVATFYNNGRAIDLVDYTYRLEIIKKDNTIVIQDTNIIKVGLNGLEIKLDPQVTILDGVVKCQFVLLKDELQDTTFTFNMNIEKSCIEGGVDSYSVITILETLNESINEANVVIKEMNDWVINHFDLIKVNERLDTDQADITKLKSDLTNTQTEVTNARKGKVNLKAKIDDMDTRINKGENLVDSGGTINGNLTVGNITPLNNQVKIGTTSNKIKEINSETINTGDFLKSTNGFNTQTNGFIENFGLVTVTGSQITVTLAKPFPVKNNTASVTIVDPAVSTGISAWVVGQNLTTVTIRTSSPCTVQWRCLGW